MSCQEDISVIVEKMLQMLRVELSGEQKILLQNYALLIMQGLKKQRLTGEKTIEGIICKQIFDSLYPLQFISLKYEGKTIDLGSGAGLPGVPIKIFRPDIHMFLLDANKRKADYLAIASEKLKLKNTVILHGRAEEFAHSIKHREQYDHLVSRAVASMAVLAEIALPLLKIGGKALFYKGPKGYDEACLAEIAIQRCGGQIADDWAYQLPTGERRTLFVVEKINCTPSEFPRTAGKPQKNPLL